MISARMVAASTLALMLLAGCGGKAVQPMATVEAVQLERYMGDWYEIARLPNRFQAMCASETRARYWLDGEVVRVVNQCRKADGTLAQADGIAKVVEGSRNAKLRVSFFRPFYGDYWILALDPDYRWVLVGEPGREYGWVLSRTPTLDEAVLQGLLDRAEVLGYERAAFKASPGRI